MAVASTHFVPYDAPGRHRSRARCGLLVDRRKHSNQPTCTTCARLHAEAELGDADDVFGPPTLGTQVHSTLSDPLAGYRPKGATR